MHDSSICSSCHQSGARLWAVPGVEVAYCVACCPLSANGYPAVWTPGPSPRLKTPTEINALELEAWSALPLWPLELQRAWLCRQMEPIAVAGAQLAAQGLGEWTRPIRSYLAPELRAVAAARGLGVESLSPEDWEDFAACFDGLISVARVLKGRGTSTRSPAPRAGEAVTIHLGSLGWAHGSDLPWRGVEGEMVATYLAEFLRKRLLASGAWSAVETLDIQRTRKRLAVYGSDPAVQARWHVQIAALVKDFFQATTPDGWTSVFELQQAAKATKGAS